MSYDRSMITGKISILTTLFGVVVIALGLIVEIPHGHVAQANTATTSVTVLNTPPTWTTDAYEATSSDPTTPTNSGSAITWTAKANDSSGDDYYLLVCKTYATPTANNNAAPSCSGGAQNLWVVSGRVASDATSTVSTTTTEGFVEKNDWTAYICDHNSNSQCNGTAKQGTSTLGVSPFYVNHRPTFTVFQVTSAANPGGAVSWAATSSDPDVVITNDTVQLFVCKASDFTGSACGAGGTWCQSGASSTDPFCSIGLDNPYPDGLYQARGYIIDNHGHAAFGGSQGSSSRMTVNNITPSITAASISLIDTDGTGPLTLTNPGGQTSAFRVQFTVTDQNSCQNASSTDEITLGYANVYRSGITSTGCDASNEYNANNCYTGLAPSALWGLSCTSNGTSTCLGTSDSDETWTCTFPLWFLAESTDGTGISTDPQYFAQNWLASARVNDDNLASSTLTDGVTGTELNSFLAYTVSTTSITYGGLQPGQSVDPVSKVTDLQSIGNVGLDQTLYGTDMCPTYPTCSGNATSTIFVANQKYASSSISYASATSLLVNPGASFLLHVNKSTSTTTPASKDTYWGIAVPGAITLSGDYFGVNTLIGFTSPSSSW